ncbi:hypothetical protein PR001_g24438 [Phytophthora rubi]|uniref:Uncharacterized protein n=1 Tax=Phytophthora rubi TaxID=129364 RepID=A0A6A3IAG8_9STRA|nr:hypothetical protein PR001_g24438 [Phytophthora rubi]
MTLEEYSIEEEQLALEGVDYPASRPIPVLLLPRETMKLYEQSFELWLFNRIIHLESLEDELEVERLFRLDFAASRVKELRRRKIVEKLAPATRLVAATTCTSKDSGQGRTTSEYRGIRSRKELLSTNVVSVQELHRADANEGPNGQMRVGERLRPIPVILGPTESRGYYEVNFEKWLTKKKVTLEMLQGDPEEERRYRQCFAHARATRSDFARGTGRQRSQRTSHLSTSGRESRSNRRRRSSSNEPPYSKKKRSASREHTDVQALKRSRVNVEDSTEAQVHGIQCGGSVCTSTIKTEYKTEQEHGD